MSIHLFMSCSLFSLPSRSGGERSEPGPRAEVLTSLTLTEDKGRLLLHACLPSFLPPAPALEDSAAAALGRKLDRPFGDASPFPFFLSLSTP